MKKLIIYFYFLLAISCNQKNNENIETFEKASIIKIEEKNIKEQYIENETLLALMETDLNEFSKNSELIIEKELIKNNHVDNLIDTIKTLKFDRIRIKSYKTASEEWIFEAKIQNSEFELLKSIKIGMEKNHLEKTLNNKIIADIIKVGNLEQTSVFVFRFKNNILEEIEYEGYVD